MCQIFLLLKTTLISITQGRHMLKDTWIHSFKSHYIHFKYCWLKAKKKKSKPLLHWLLSHYPRSKMSHRLVSGGSPHALYDSISLCPTMRLYFPNIRARLRNLKKPCEKQIFFTLPICFIYKTDLLTYHCCFRNKMYAVSHKSFWPLRCLKWP